MIYFAERARFHALPLVAYHEFFVRNFASKLKF